MIAHDYNWVDGVPGVSTCSSCSSSYTELLSFKLNLLNYTTLSYGANSPYTCYIGGNTVVYPSTPCTYDTTSNIVDIYAPILGVPSSFDYVESEGSPRQFSSITGLLTSSVPGGVDTSQYSGKATQEPHHRSVRRRHHRREHRHAPMRQEQLTLRPARSPQPCPAPLVV